MRSGGELLTNRLLRPSAPVFRPMSMRAYSGRFRRLCVGSGNIILFLLHLQGETTLVAKPRIPFAVGSPQEEYKQLPPIKRHRKRTSGTPAIRQENFGACRRAHRLSG